MHNTNPNKFEFKFSPSLADKYSIWEWEAYPVANGKLPPEVATFKEWKEVLDEWKRNWNP